jgi:hypothetical protein
MLRALFNWTDFSLSCLFPAPWGIEDRRRGEVDPLREVKLQKIARLFAQIGYRQIGTSGYMFLEKSQLKDELVLVEEGDTMKYAPSHHLASYKPDLSALDDELIDAIQSRRPDLARVRAAITKVYIYTYLYMYIYIYLYIYIHLYMLYIYLCKNKYVYKQIHI